MEKELLKIGDRVRFMYEVYSQGVSTFGNIVKMNEDTCEIDTGSSVIFTVPYYRIHQKIKTKEELREERETLSKTIIEKNKARPFYLPSLSGVSVRKKEEHHSSRMSTERKTI